MSVASRIEQIEEHIGDIYDTLELGGADLTNVNKNIININSQLKDRMIDYMNNGTQEIWDNWEKVTGTGTELTLNSTIEAPMELGYKGNTSQETTTGKNLLSFGTKSFTTYYQETGLNIPTGTYTFSTKITSSDTSLQYSRIYFYGTDSSTQSTFITLSRGSRVSGTITTNFVIDRIVLYSSIDYANSNGKTATYEDMQLEVGSTVTAYEPYTNGPSPNPDYPQDVHVVSGNNTIKVESENLFGIKQWLDTLGATYTENSDGSITFTTITSLYNTTYPIKETDRVTFSYKITNGTGTNFRFRYMYDNGTESSTTGSSSGTSEVSVSTTSSMDKKVIGIRGNWTTAGTFTIREAMLEEYVYSVSPRPYKPYQSQSYNVNLPTGMELCKISTYKDKFIRNSGKNLVNRSTCYENKILTWAAGVLYNNDGSLTTDFIEASANETIQTSHNAYVFCYDEDKEFLGSINQQGELVKVSSTYWKTRQLPDVSDIAFIRLVYNVNIAGNANILTDNVMANKGSTLLDYEPYGSGEWYKYSAIGKVVLDGSESGWALYNASGSAPRRFGLYQSKWYKNGIDIISNYFIGGGFNSQVDLSIWTQTYYLAITDKNSNWGSATALQNWLSTHNTIVYYVLATPTYTKLTDTTLINQLEAIKKSMNKQTNISQINNDLPFELDVTALKEV